MLSKTRSSVQLPPRNQLETVNFLQTSIQQRTAGAITQPGGPGKAGLFHWQSEP